MRLLNTYLVQIKQKLIKNNQALKKRNDKRIRLINIICEYLDKDTFMFDDFIKNSNVRNLINDVVKDDRIKNNIINSMDDLKRISWADLVTNINNSAVEKKNKMLNCLKELLGYLNRNPIYFYYDLDKELSFFDNLSKDVVDLDSRYERMFIRLGLTGDEILRLRFFVSKQNMEVYRKKINEINKSQKEKEDKIIIKNLQKEENLRRRNVLSKNCSLEVKNLLNNAQKLLSEYPKEYSKEDYNMAIAYKDVLLSDLLESLIPSLSQTDYMKYLIINISYISTYINDNKDKCTESELSDKINELKKLYSNYVIFKKQMTDKSIKDEDNDTKNYLDEDKYITIHYLINENKDSSYYFDALKENENDKKFTSDAEKIIEKMKKGIYQKGGKKIVNGNENIFYAKQDLTYLSFIILDDSNYLIITADKWKNKNFISITKSICDKEKEQIRNVKKQIVGGSYDN